MGQNCFPFATLAEAAMIEARDSNCYSRGPCLDGGQNDSTALASLGYRKCVWQDYSVIRFCAHVGLTPLPANASGQQWMKRHEGLTFDRVEIRIISGIPLPLPHRVLGFLRVC